MKILHVISNLSVGGAEMHLLSLADGLSRSGHDVSVAYFREQPDEARSLVPDFQSSRIKLFDLGYNSNKILAWIRLFRIVRELKPDIVHTHLSRRDMLAPRLSRLAGASSVISTVHNVEPFFNSSIWRPIIRWSYGANDCLIGISGAVIKTLKHQLMIPNQKLELIHYGINVERFLTKEGNDLKQEFGFAKNDFVIGNIGRLDPQKGQKYLIRAMPLIKEASPNARLVIVGHDCGLKDDLQELIESLGLQGDVIITGFRDATSVLKTFDIFVLPSLWEGLGLVLLEAMACKKPVVASNIDAIPEIVDNGKTGFLVSPKDTKALAEAIIKILQDSNLLKSLGDAGYHRAISEFSINKMVTKTTEVYEELCKNH